jgi:hypothetical protein
MKLNIKAFVLTCAILWAAAIFIVGMANLICPGYGAAFLQVMASIYPGYDGSVTFGSVIVGTLYAVVDGAIGGLVFAWLYNMFLGKEITAKDAA